MESIETLAEKTYDFLVKYGRIKTGEEPVIEQEILNPALEGMHPHFRHEYEADETIRVSAQDYAPKSGKSITDKEIKQILIEKIPDKKNTVVADVGSAVGNYFAIPFSQRNKNARVFAVDMFDREYFRGGYLYHWISCMENPLEVLEEFAKYHNSSVSYVNSTLTDSRGLEFLEQAREPKDFLAVVSFRSMRNLAYYTIKNAIRHNADIALITHSAIENMKPNGGFFPVSRFFMDKTNGMRRETQENLRNLIKGLSSTYPRIELEEISPTCKKRTLIPDKKSEIYAPMAKQLFILDYAMLLREAGYNAAIFNHSLVDTNRNLRKEIRDSIKLMEKLGCMDSEIYLREKDLGIIRKFELVGDDASKVKSLNHPEHLLYAYKGKDILGLAK